MKSNRTLMKHRLATINMMVTLTPEHGGRRHGAIKTGRGLGHGRAGQNPPIGLPPALRHLDGRPIQTGAWRNVWPEELRR